MITTFGALAKALAAAVDRRRDLLPAAQVDGLDRAVAALHATWPDRDDAVAFRLDRLADVFDLDDLDVALLMVAASPELDANAGLAIGLLHGSGQPQRIGVDLALELAGWGPGDAPGRRHLHPGAPLATHGLVRIDGAGPFPARTLVVPDRVCAHLAGHDAPDPLTVRLQVSTVTMPSPQVEPVTAALDRPESLCYVHARPGSAGLALAASAFAAAELPFLAVDLGRRGAVAADTAVATVLLDAALLGCGLILVGADDAADEGPIFDRIAAGPVPAIALGRRRWDAAWLRWLPPTVEAMTSTVAHREEVWRRVLAAAGHDPATVSTDALWPGLVSLNLLPEEILQVVAAAGPPDREPTCADLRVAARRLGSTGREGAGLHRRDAAVGFDDLVLPDPTADVLRELIGWAQVRDTLLAEGDVTGKGGKGRGLVALFTGSPGTGKTLAAHVVAGALGMDLQTVDLSVVVDKYIGETEKHLERIFHQAESMNCVLFFDEADSLFGARSAVRDSHDRHANQEVAYLLQRIEAFDGVALLSTNLRGNIDPAFTRRMHFVVVFPDPPAPTRRLLWDAHLAEVRRHDPDDPVPVDALAESLELTGGEIRNIVMTAAFRAATAGESLGMRHLRIGIEREYVKLSRRVPAAALSSLTATGLHTSVTTDVPGPRERP